MEIHLASERPPNEPISAGPAGGFTRLVCPGEVIFEDTTNMR